MVAILVGLFCVRLKVVKPADGHLKGLGFFIGSMVFPLLIFSTVATAELHSVSYRVIAACSLGKIAVMILTWLVAYAVFQPKRSQGQRVLTASVFASILREVQFSADAGSIFCGLVFSACLLLIRQHWGFTCPAKQLLFFYGLVLTAYAAVSFSINPFISHATCAEFNDVGLRTPLVVAFSWLQSSASCMFLAAVYVSLWAKGVFKRALERLWMCLWVPPLCTSTSFLSQPQIQSTRFATMKSLGLCNFASVWFGLASSWWLLHVWPSIPFVACPEKAQAAILRQTTPSRMLNCSSGSWASNHGSPRSEDCTSSPGERCRLGTLYTQRPGNSWTFLEQLILKRSTCYLSVLNYFVDDTIRGYMIFIDIQWYYIQIIPDSTLQNVIFFCDCSFSQDAHCIDWEFRHCRSIRASQNRFDLKQTGARCERNWVALIGQHSCTLKVWF